MVKTSYIPCCCKFPEHALIFAYYDSVNILEVAVHLNPNKSFWKRLLIGIKYIFGKSSECDFEMFELYTEDKNSTKELLEISEVLDIAIKDISKTNTRR